MNICENGNIVSILYPSDIQTAVADDWINLKGYGHLDVVFFKGAGTAGDDPTLTFAQATVVAGTDTKALTIVDKYYLKQGTLLSTSTVGGVFTKTTQTKATTIVGDGTSAEEQMIMVIPIDAEDLDVDNGFCCVQVSVGDVGSNAQFGCILGILTDPRYGGETPINPLTD